jgi:protein TonB
MRRRRHPLLVLLRRVVALISAVGLTLLFFLVLPVMQHIGNPVRDLVELRSVDLANLPPPPPPPPEPEPEEEPEEEPPPPELMEEAPPLDLAQIELALNPGLGGEGLGDFTIGLVNQLAGEEGSEEIDRIFSLAELDQRPRVLYQRMPSYPPELRRSGQKGTVSVLFTVDARGRVLNAKAERASHPAFERAALEAVKQWRFEPGTRNGEKVSFKLRIPITFNAG